MKNLTPPTDNLYKFIAISGMILFLSSGWLLSVRHVELELKLAEVEGQLKAVEVQDEWLSGQGINNLNDAENDPIKMDILIKHRENIQKVRALHEMSVGILKTLKIQSIFCIVGLIIGATMSCVGFKLWYTRLQIYQDSELKSEKAHAEQKAGENASRPTA